jgi:hypothetical protein
MVFLWHTEPKLLQYFMMGGYVLLCNVYGNFFCEALHFVQVV